EFYVQQQHGGHEMIHATHRMAKQHAGRADVNYTGLEGVPRAAPNEEARPVGVGGTTRPNDITENHFVRC
ncbi:MAG: hypothetical protein OEV99_18180, partial [Nitrospira sp.]|nr:hypothetical protein [Nitrospira sp.]